MTTDLAVNEQFNLFVEYPFWSPFDLEHLGDERQADGVLLAGGKAQARLLLDPGQRLVRVNPRPR